MPFKKTISWAAVGLWMGLLFYFSHQPATQSNELSTGITNTIITTVESMAPNLNLDLSNLNHFVRKNAHFFAYLVLGILVMNALRRSGMRGYRCMITALLIGVLYAISDEVHQLFIPGRSGEVRDVLIDTAGTAVGIGVYWLVARVGRCLSLPGF
ncbi:VanZ family protein [Virgibacillus natechei]|uniref:VanZ family protein n=1 Tax=Virgibacillus natechei TaxID=1216297 RepID=A0ABS4IKC2_9BACI|nr:VanZ family protein [Virgibacillus natechei]MBP1971410.1 VanZ family protein [Virgibacillus natechei]UZD12223.1 VanZ family protein [Virgibacillus natechei]